MPEPAMRIDVFSDVVCPWCWLGRTRLEAALDRLDFGEEVEVHWRAFQLDPTATAEPQDLRAELERKYGPGAYDAMTERLVVLGREAGLDYRFDRAIRVTSLPALRLVAWVDEVVGPEAASDLHARLFRAYFAEGANIADPDQLVAWAVEVGADPAAARTAVAEGAGADAVTADLQWARRANITGVPAFVIDQRHLIPGAQDVDTMVALLSRVHTAA
jgi:predicted DsbA family dithiol-disulfide isomerase